MKTKREVENEAIGIHEPEVKNEMVEIRVLPKGDGMISSGNHDPKGGDEVYERGDTLELPRDIAEALEERGFAEIQQARRGPGRPPKAENASEEGAN